MNMLFSGDAGTQSHTHKENKRPTRPTEHLSPYGDNELRGDTTPGSTRPTTPPMENTNQSKGFDGHPPLAATSSAAPAARKVPRVPGEKLAIAELAAPREPDEIGPCPTCGCPLAWESIYRDGVKKCEQCHPAPSRRIVGERWAIVTAGVEVLPGGEIRGDPAPSHSWQPLRDCWRHAAALAELAAV